MFLSLKGLDIKNKQNLFKLVNKNLTRSKMQFSLKKQFSNLGKNQIQNARDENISIDNYFSQNEQYIVNFYKKHKEDFLHQETHDKEFENFLNKMEMLISKESLLAREVNNLIGNINKISVQGREPLREVLIFYQQFVTSFGFNSEALSETLLHLGQVFRSRENFHRVYHDFTHWEFINSYRMYHIIDDLTFALSNDKTYITADQISRCVQGLTLCGYKNTKLVHLIIEKVSCMLNEKKMNKIYEGSYANTPGAGRAKYIESNPHADDIFYQKDFVKNVWKLLQIKIDEDEADSKAKRENLSNSMDKSQEDILGHIREIIGLLKETKEIQHNLTDTFDNLLDQYFKIEQALVENPELKYNQYIKFQVYKLQDKLVEAGYISIDTIKSLTNKKLSDEELDKMKFNNIINVLQDFSLINFPNLYNTGEQTLDSLLDKNNENSLNNFEMKSSMYRIDVKSLGKILTALSEYSKITNIDINGEDYCNEKLVKDFPHIQNNSDKEHIKFKVEYTKLFNIVETFLRCLEPEILKKISNSEDLAGLGYIYYAYANMNISSCNELRNSILTRVTQLSKIKSITESLNNEDVKHLVVGLAKGVEWNKEIKKDVERIVANLNINELHKIEDMIKLLWSLSAFDLYTNDKYIQILIKLSENSESLLNYISNINDSELILNLYQLSVCLKYEAKDITIPSNLSFLNELYSNLNNFYFLKSSMQIDTINNTSFTNELLSDPVKETLLNGIQDGILDKEIQRKTTEGLTYLENSGLVEKIPFNPNFIFGYYGHKIALFVLGRDYSSDDSNNLNGFCKIARRILKKYFNTNAVFIQTSQLIEFDLNTIIMKFRKPSDDQKLPDVLESTIAKQLDFQIEYEKLNKVNKYLNLFIQKFSKSEVGEIIFHTEPAECLEEFLNSLWQVFDLHSDVVYTYYPSVLERKIVDLKVALSRNKLLFETMSDNFKNYVNDILKEIIGV